MSHRNIGPHSAPCAWGINFTRRRPGVTFSQCSSMCLSWRWDVTNWALESHIFTRRVQNQVFVWPFTQRQAIRSNPEPYFPPLVDPRSRTWHLAHELLELVKRIANSSSHAYLPTWQYARWLLPANPTCTSNRVSLGHGLGNWRCSWLSCLSRSVIIPTHWTGLSAASTALISRPTLSGTEEGSSRFLSCSCRFTHCPRGFYG